MRIELKNFQCHENSKFDIPEEGLVALTGSSGCGKSTVLSAISYALYGSFPSKKSRKPYTHGANTCKVTLRYEKMQLLVTRTSKPNRLLVEYPVGKSSSSSKTKKYEDDEAQSIICKQMGMTYKEFIAGAYIFQRGETSVLSMTPMDQLRFVEVLANATTEKFKIDLKAKSKEVSEQRIAVEAELGVLISNYDTIKSKVESTAKRDRKTYYRGGCRDTQRRTLWIVRKPE